MSFAFYLDRSDPVERPAQIGDQIALGFEAGREAHQLIADAEFGARLRLEPRMRGGRRMGHEALRVTQIVRDVDQPQRVEKAKAPRLVTSDIKGDKTAARCHL